MIQPVPLNGFNALQFNYTILHIKNQRRKQYPPEIVYTYSRNTDSSNLSVVPNLFIILIHFL